LSFVLFLAIPAAAAADCPGQADNIETVVEAFLENEAVQSLDEIPSYAAARWDSEGSRLMGHPLQPLVWLAQQMKAEGRSLKAGDVVALGSFGPPLTPEMPGQDMLVTYTDEAGADLPGGPLSVRVRFTAP
jgi:hypothetical protein